MSDEEKRRRRIRKKLWPLMSVLVLLLAVVVVPPLVNIGRYKGQITRLLSASLGRPVRLSSVELRMLPRPGFVLTDLTVSEDPAYGAEPILHANTVTAGVRLFSLWRGRLEISRIGVDEASLNVTRTADGRWNLDAFFRTAASRSQGAAQTSALPMPYFEATNSRVNLKNGLEKLPFSLMNADLSFWQESPGDWRLRLRGQPARTDVNLDLADTGVVRLEATMRHAAEFRQMPVHLEMEWREAQLGQLSRLILGSDPGWRGDLTGQLQLDGTAAAAQVKTRLSATSVHRVEFAPADPLDFDANCAFVYHYSSRTVENLACDSPFGEGHIRVAGSVPGNAPGRLAIELQRIPVSAGLDVLRTLRSGVAQGLEARGTLSGQLTYDSSGEQKSANEIAAFPRRPKTKQPDKNNSAVPAALTGSLTIDRFSLTGDGLSQPIQATKVLLQPEITQEGVAHALTTTVSLPAGAPTPLILAAHFSLYGYQLSLRGPATLSRIRELARVAGIEDVQMLEGFAGDPANLDLSCKGSWLPSQSLPIESSENHRDGGSDQLSGNVIFRNANWKSESLANTVEIPEATLHLGEEGPVWGPVEFQYGPIKGTANLQPSTACGVTQQCAPQLALEFSELDAATLQSTLLGTHPQGTVFSNLFARLTPATTPVWPRVDGMVKADSLILGPVKLQNAVISVRLLQAEADFNGISAGLLGGRFHATGKVTNGEKPKYAFEGSFSNVSGSSFCQLFALQCTGPIDGTGEVELSGFSEKDLADSATGVLHFEWQRGTVRASPTVQIPKALSHFERWNGDAAIAEGMVSLKESEIRQGAHSANAEATITLEDAPKVKVELIRAGDPASNSQQLAPVQ
jgi:AsmA family